MPTGMLDSNTVWGEAADTSSHLGRHPGSSLPLEFTEENAEQKMDCNRSHGQLSSRARGGKNHYSQERVG